MLEKPCFIILPGFAPDSVPTLPLKSYLENLGYPVVVSNFWGDGAVDDFSKLKLATCIDGVNNLITKTSEKYSVIIGVGISLGAALLIEYAKEKDAKLNHIMAIGAPFSLKNRWLVSLGILTLPILNPIWKILRKTKRFRRLPPIDASRMVVGYLEGGFLDNLQRVTAPISFFHSKRDPIADYKAVYEFSNKMINSETEIIISEEKEHTGNHDDITKKMTARIIKLTAGLS